MRVSPDLEGLQRDLARVGRSTAPPTERRGASISHCLPWRGAWERKRRDARCLRVVLCLVCVCAEERRDHECLNTPPRRPANPPNQIYPSPSKTKKRAVSRPVETERESSNRVSASRMVRNQRGRESGEVAVDDEDECSCMPLPPNLHQSKGFDMSPWHSTQLLPSMQSTSS